ncbi:MAG: transketolase [Armatimonadetes bacterium]|nr:transketolase [Armatimonadota bacterium]
MPTLAPTDLDTLCVNVIRGLSMDAVQKANSGHPGLPLGAAPMAYELWRHHMRHNPANPKWMNRDRFILSAGHGSMLLYSLLHLFGYGVSLDDIKNFRQWGSITPGHPENIETPGVEMATGPLGQGVATSVGMAIAESYLSAKFEVFDHYTYALCSDGDLMEGVAQEAASLAGHLGLGKLIWLYDDNGITIDGGTELSFSDDTGAKFAAMGWHIQRIDGMDMAAVGTAIENAQNATDKPSLILCKTIIGFGSPHKAGKSSSHGSPLGPDEIKLTKEALGLPTDQEFYIPESALAEFKAFDGATMEAEWNQQVAQYKAAHPDMAAELDAVLSGDIMLDYSKVPQFTDPIATRNASHQVLNALADQIPALLGGSADLTDNVFTGQKAATGYQKDNHLGRNIYYGVREHAMMAAVNGITLHGGCKAIGGTFLIFCDYCRPSIRLAALMETPSIFNFSHDSIGLGEDGPTHQPIEQIMSLRTIPNLNVIRPADGHELAACWKVAFESEKTPTVIVTSRQPLPILSPFGAEHPALKGAYILREASSAPKVILVATGSEVALAFDSATALEAEGIPTRVVSMPSWFLFEKQSAEYRKSILPKSIPSVSLEAGTTLGWAKYAQAHVGIDHFGASAPAKVLFEKFGFTVENVLKTTKDLLEA